MTDISPEILHSLFPEKNKNDILTSSYPEITQKLDSLSPKIFGNYRRILTFGTVFETLAVRERLTDTPETKAQSGMRLLVEEMYQQSQLALGELTPVSTPDFVSVIFDKAGNLVVDQILEMKTSNKALSVGLNKEQPKKTLNTMERVVDLINSVVEKRDISHLVSKDTTSNKIERKRNILLNKLLKQITDLDIHEKISFSPDLEYLVVLPEGEIGNKRNLDLIKLVSKEGKIVEIKTSNSKFSKNDIHKIIDHYAEDNIE